MIVACELIKNLASESRENHDVVCGAGEYGTRRGPNGRCGCVDKWDEGGERASFEWAGRKRAWREWSKGGKE